MRATVLVVDDDERLRETLAILVRSLGHEAVRPRTSPAATTILGERDVDLVISDLRMPGGSGLDLLDAVAAAGPAPRSSCSPPTAPSRPRCRRCRTAPSTTC